MKATHAYCGATAAVLLGIPLPLRLRNATQLHVGTVDGAQPPRRRGVKGVRLAAGTGLDQAPGGFTVTDAASTWCQLALQLSLAELIAAGDHIISGTRLRGGSRTTPMCVPAQLAQAVEEYAPRRGVAALRLALPRLRTGVDSSPRAG